VDADHVSYDEAYILNPIERLSRKSPILSSDQKVCLPKYRALDLLSSMWSTGVQHHQNLYTYVHPSHHTALITFHFNYILTKPSYIVQYD